MAGIKSIINSMLWAAYGDAFGFITELCDAKVLKYRTYGIDRVTQLIHWRRKLGGIYGVSMELPEGCYSDDTQLRLAVCRSIKKDGKFDFETFSKIEVPVFLAYGLGIGRGTKVAGESLQKKTIQWNTNFFETKTNNYIAGGGNGAAMRIQPHVWAASSQVTDRELIREIMRDAIITHGHPIGWVGAVFHGLTLWCSLPEGQCPGPDKWEAILEKARMIPEICQEDSLLKDIWVPTWERYAGKSIEKGVADAIDDMMADIKKIRQTLPDGTCNLSYSQTDSGQKYHDVVTVIDAFNLKTRGSATKTALLSTYIAYFYSQDPRKGIEICANTLGSDTDTIASMAGAILGTCIDTQPPQRVLDYEYLVNQAQRLCDISCGKAVPQFVYPDLLHWDLPKSSLDFLGYFNSKPALYGLGILQPQGKAISQKYGRDATYSNFFKTSFGQTVLLKYRKNISDLPPHGMPRDLVDEKRRHTPGLSTQSESTSVNAKTIDSHSKQTEKYNPINFPLRGKSLNEVTDLLIRNGFNEIDIGKQLLSFAEEENGVEKSIAFSSIMVKAKREENKKIASLK